MATGMLNGLVEFVRTRFSHPIMDFAEARAAAAAFSGFTAAEIRIFTFSIAHMM
ncbi:hypothetical protein QEH56_11290 [Pelagicoccus enzymogenes]|uniref:hypothetical protein n=1 Tax=Pelagicoccus enzymogenes TaxID=2773457 RepID=UPI002810429C|nr:hypothetical protein [Pelagicoccus enzymogenes]MDQ8198738.1 hypothetical protein [Pelagicoccus enzymogenes]